MAILQNIREKCGVLVIVIVGIALLAFLLGDFLSSGRIGRGDETVIAKIDGSKVDYTEWQKNYNNHRLYYEIAQQGRNIDSNTEKSLRESAWSDIMNTYVWEKFYDEVGLGVSEEELEDLLYGPEHAHSIIVQNFGLQKDTAGKYDTNGPKNFFDNADADPNYKVIADYWKDAIKKDQMNTKYQNMLTKGFYTPTALAKMYYEDMTNTVDFIYASRDYKSIKDEEITVSDEDMKAYYEKHKNRFVEDNNNRDLTYVVFEVTPSEKDINDIKNNTEELRKEMMELQGNVLSFAQINSSSTNSEDRSSYKDDVFMTLKEVETIGLNEEFFNSEKGTTSEIVTNRKFMLFGQILDNAMRPDSVNASHILIMPKDTTETLEMCKAKADSLANVLRNAKADSATFAQMAIQYSQDPGSKDNGGYLGDFREGMMITEFNNACFENAAGTIQVVESPYGIHIIKINSQTAPVRKVKLAVLDQEIKFSDDTYEEVFQTANKFFIACNTNPENFDKIVEEQGLTPRVANKINDMSDNIIVGMDNSREIVRWAFEEDRQQGDISDVIESSMRDRFIIAKLANVREKGFTPFEETKATIEPEVRKELKAAKMMEEMKGMSIEEVAQKFNAKTDTLTNISFASFSIPGLGLIEPKLNAVVTNIAENTVSEPIDGNNGVYVIKVIKKTVAPEKQDFENDKLAKMQESMRNSAYRMNNAVKKAIKIEDRRAKFF